MEGEHVVFGDGGSDFFIDGFCEAFLAEVLPRVRSIKESRPVLTCSAILLLCAHGVTRVFILLSAND